MMMMIRAKWEINLCQNTENTEQNTKLKGSVFSSLQNLSYFALLLHFNLIAFSIVFPSHLWP